MSDQAQQKPAASSMRLQWPSTPANQPAEPERITLDPNGDVILSVTSKEGDAQLSREFLVNTKALSMASPVFKQLFGPTWAEGQEIAKGSCPTIKLHEDDPDAMSAILHVLHHKTPKLVMKPFEQANIAIACDKYDCCTALQAWGNLWLSEGDLGGISIGSLGCLLLAAYFLEAPRFTRISAQCQLHLRLTSRGAIAWQGEFPEVEKRLPPKVIGEKYRRSFRSLS